MAYLLKVVSRCTGTLFRFRTGLLCLTQKALEVLCGPADCQSLTEASQHDGVQEMFGLELDLTWVYELDSSSSTKFSRHLVIRVPGMAFCSNIHAGCLVARALDLATSEGDGSHDLLVNQVRWRAASYRHAMWIDMRKAARQTRTRLSDRGGCTSPPS